MLVEIADRQPAVDQGEIASAVGATSRVVSEYVSELVEDGFVEKEARSRYRVTKEGVDWLFQQAADVRRFAEHVTDDVLGSVQDDAAVATGAIEERDGQPYRPRWAAPRRTRGRGSGDERRHHRRH